MERRRATNYRKIADEDRVRVGNEVLFEDCKYDQLPDYKVEGIFLSLFYNYFY